MRNGGLKIEHKRVVLDGRIVNQRELARGRITERNFHQPVGDCVGFFGLLIRSPERFAIDGQNCVAEVALVAICVQGPREERSAIPQDEKIVLVITASQECKSLACPVIGEHRLVTEMIRDHHQRRAAEVLRVQPAKDDFLFRLASGFEVKDTDAVRGRIERDFSFDIIEFVPCEDAGSQVEPRHTIF